jgi:hypothetical protein
MISASYIPQPDRKAGYGYHREVGPDRGKSYPSLEYIRRRLIQNNAKVLGPSVVGRYQDKTRIVHAPGGFTFVLEVWRFRGDRCWRVIGAEFELPKVAYDQGTPEALLNLTGWDWNKE